MRKLVLAVIVFACAAGAVGYYAVRRLNEPFQGYEGAEQFVDIPSGANTRTIGDALIAKGIVRDETTYRFALWRSGEARRLQAGEYRFDHPRSEERRVGKECRSRWAAYHSNRNRKIIV